MAIDESSVFTRLTWEDWQVLEDLLRRTRARRIQGLPKQDKDNPEGLTEDRRTTELLLNRDVVIPFDEVYRFGRWNAGGMYIAALLSLQHRQPDLKLDNVRAEFPSPPALSRFLDEQDIFGVKLDRLSKKNEQTAASTTPPTGTQ